MFSNLDTPAKGRFLTRFYLKSGRHRIFTAAIYAETGYGVENSELLRISHEKCPSFFAFFGWL